MDIGELMPEMFKRSRLMYLNFAEIPANTPADENIAHFFAECEEKDVNPRLPEHRQVFNNHVLTKTGARYLVSRYGEDRSAMLAGSSIAKEGRTLHLGIDIFSRNLEPVFAPCKGRIIRAAREEDAHGYGNYVIFQPAAPLIPSLFLGHLSKSLPTLGEVEAGSTIAWLGDYKGNENGGWSRHLHLQLLEELPPEGKTPNGYSTTADFTAISQKFPDPMTFFPEWKLK